MISDVTDKKLSVQASIGILPNELLVQIFSYLPAPDHASCQLTCKIWRRAACDRALMKPLLLNNPFNLRKAVASPLWSQAVDGELSRINDEFIYFGPGEWEKFLGDVGAVAPLPENINEILTSPCPIFEGKRIVETHALIYIPEEVNKKTLTLKNFRELIKKPKNGGNPTDFHYIWDLMLKDLGNIPIDKSHWILMTKYLIPESLGKIFDEQKDLIDNLNLKTGIPYELPTLLIGAITLALPYISAGKRLEDLSRFLCHECIQPNWRGLMWGIAKMEPWRLFITTDAIATSANHRSNIGVAVMMKI